MVYEGRAVNLRVDTVRTPGSRETTREIVEHEDCVAIIAIDDKGNILLVSQFRKPVEKELLETGFLPRKVEKLGGFYSSPGFCTEYLHLYLATDLVFRPLKAEDSESIKLVRVPPAQIPALIASGAICDAKSIAGLLVFLAHQKSAESA
jgi:ADP-ribose pyrophosphatase